MSKETDLSAQSGVHPALVPPKAERKALKIGSSSYVPTLALLQGMSDDAAIEGNSAGDFYYKQDGINLGREFKAVVLGRRSHAILFDGKKKVSESFDPDSPLFKEIQRTKTKGPVRPSSGSEWFLYIPEHELFTTFFCGKKSLNPTSERMMDCMTPLSDRPDTEIAQGEPCTTYFLFKSFWKVWNEEYKAWIMIVDPLEAPADGSIPFDKEKCETLLNLFHGAVASEGKLEEAPASDEEVSR